MTTLYVVDDVPLADAVAARLRGVMAELRITQTRFQELTGWTRGVMQQRYSGKVPLDVADLELIQKRTGIQIDYLMREQGPRYVPPGDGGGPTTAAPTAGKSS